eukprot:scaffold153776_cov32-Attheya_sp.AAC.2
MDNGFSELPCEEAFENNIQVAPSSAAHGPAAIPFVLNKKQQRKYRSWDEMFKELVGFKKINGHMNVPQRSGPLGAWIHAQRQSFHPLKGSIDSPLTNGRHGKLEGIGFVFVCPPRGPPWDQRFQELVDFKKNNGHMNVPSHSGPLGPWICTQRQAFNQFKGGKDSPLTNGRREKLESIGFVFVSSPRRPPWDERFQELVDFKKINGHTNVPQGFGPLGNWVCTQRQAFNQFKGGKDSPLTNGRREKLESIGFVFVCSPRSPSWDARFQELVDFKKNNGHTNVPSLSGPLGTWVRTQRRAFLQFKGVKDSPMTIERRDKLNSIGFRFNIHKKNHDHS